MHVQHAFLIQRGQHPEIPRNPGKALNFEKGPGKGPEKVFSPGVLEKCLER